MSSTVTEQRLDVVHRTVHEPVASRRHHIQLAIMVHVPHEYAVARIREDCALRQREVPRSVIQQHVHDFLISCVCAAFHDVLRAIAVHIAYRHVS